MKARRIVTRENSCIIVPARLTTYSHRTEVTLYADETGHGIEFAGAASDLREPIPRHLLDVSTMDRQAATLPHWHPKGAIAK